MRVSELIGFLVERTGLETKTVTAHARELVIAGMLPKARGRAIPEVTQEQRANLLISLACSEAITGCALITAELMNAVTEFERPKINFKDYLVENLTLLSNYDVNCFDYWKEAEISVNRQVAAVQIRASTQKTYVPSGYAAPLIFVNYDSFDQEVSRWHARRGLPIMSLISGELLIEVATGYAFATACVQFDDARQQIKQEGD